MDILLTVGFWIALYIYLSFIHVILLGIISIFIALPFNVLKLGDESGVIIGSNIGAAIFLYGYAYNALWFNYFNELAPISFYILGLIATYMGSGSNEVEANLGNKLMSSGEVTGIIICIGIALWNGASIF